MKLEDIGFYTLSDKRAKNVSWDSQLHRCELILTDKCNFKCAYCRGIKEELRGDLSYIEALNIVDLWCEVGLRNIRFSGGEPTIWPHLENIVKYTKSKRCIDRIAISTNGSAPLQVYLALVEAGVSDFSISLDACCSAIADKMAGVNAMHENVSTVIRALSQRTYVTVGIVVDDRNIQELPRTIEYAGKLGVSDIRIIPSAQSNKRLKVSLQTNLPILKYRLNNIQKGHHVRGMSTRDCSRCHLVKDDMVILHNKHFPCVIYMREQGAAIGSIDGKSIQQIREERRKWFKDHDSYRNKICRENCLDVCIAHNNKVEEYERCK